MNIKLFAAAAVLALGGLSGHAHAAGETWTVTTKGHIASGTDTTGVFGTAGQDLYGLSYTQSITASVDRAEWSSGLYYGYFERMNGVGPAFTTTVTVDGHSATFDIASTVEGQQLISNDTSKGRPHGYTDSIYTFEVGYTAGGDYLNVQSYVNSFSLPFVPTLNFSQKISQDSTGGDWATLSTFNISGIQNADFNATVEFIEVNVSAVPEPGTYAMLLAGLGLVGFAVCRKRIAA